MTALAAITVAGVSVQSDAVARSLDSFRRQLALMEMQLRDLISRADGPQGAAQLVTFQRIRDLLTQFQQLAGADAVRALGMIRQIIDAINASIAALSSATLKSGGTAPRSRPSLIESDRANLNQRLIVLENVLVSRQAAANASLSVQRVRFTLVKPAPAPTIVTLISPSPVVRR